MSKKICILHDTFIYRGGGERLIFMMAQALGADIASGFFDAGSFDLRAAGFKGKIIPVMPAFFRQGFSWLPKKPAFIINNGLKHLGLKFFFAFNTKFLREYDVVIFSGDCLAGARNIGKNTKAYYYCHTPPRYLFDQRDTYLVKVPKSIRWFYNILTNGYKKLYFRDLKKMGAIFTNSTNTKNRLKHFTGYDAGIIYPPVDLSRFIPSEIRGDYYYSWARLSTIKRVDRIVEAFARMPDKNLIFSYGINDPEKEIILGKLRNGKYKMSSGVEGNGTEGPPLDSSEKKITEDSSPALAGSEGQSVYGKGQFFESFPYYPNIRAIQSPDDPELIKLISESIASIYIPVDEDFGMTPVESMACGVPVIGVNDGGLKESVIDGKTGILIGKEANIDELCQAIQSLTLEKSLTMKGDCIEQAGKFGLEEFGKIVNAKMS